MDRRDVLKMGALGLVVVPSSGCATLLNWIRTGLRDPEIRITKMKLTDVMLDRVTMIFDTELKNPNPIGFSLAGLAYALEVEGSRLASGKVNEELTLKANGTSKMSFPVEFALGKTGAELGREEKNAISHRGQAFRALHALMLERFPAGQ